MAYFKIFTAVRGTNITEIKRVVLSVVVIVIIVLVNKNNSQHWLNTGYVLGAIMLDILYGQVVFSLRCKKREVSG